MSISPQSGARWLERLIWLEYDIVLKWQNTFNSGLNTAKNTHHTKKASIKSSSELNFIEKSPQAHMFTCPQEWSQGGLERLIWLNIILYRKMGLLGTRRILETTLFFFFCIVVYSKQIQWRRYFLYNFLEGTCGNMFRRYQFHFLSYRWHRIFQTKSSDFL